MVDLTKDGWSCCFPKEVVGVNVGLACFDGIIALLAFSQIIRIHSRNSQLGWTRQKVFHLLIGSSNIGYFVYFVLTIIVTCNRWMLWSYLFGFIFMALPKILSFVTFLLLLSFWIDLCHQANDEDYEEECSSREALLNRTPSDQRLARADSHRICLPFRLTHVGSRQRIVIWVTVIVFVLTIATAVLMWMGQAINFVGSSSLTKVYVVVFSIAMLLLGGALAFYGLLLCMKMRSVRSEEAASEMWKVAGLAVVSVVCFTSSAAVAVFLDIPVLYYCQQLHQNGLYIATVLIVYHFIGSSVPSAFLLWITRELPPNVGTNVHEESTTITIFLDSSGAANPQR